MQRPRGSTIIEMRDLLAVGTVWAAIAQAQIAIRMSFVVTWSGYEQGPMRECRLGRTVNASNCEGKVR